MIAFSSSSTKLEPRNKNDGSPKFPEENAFSKDSAAPSEDGHWLPEDSVRHDWLPAAVELNNCALFQAAVQPARRHIRQKLIQVFCDFGRRKDQTIELFEDEIVVMAFKKICESPAMELQKALEDAINAVYSNEQSIASQDNVESTLAAQL